MTEQIDVIEKPLPPGDGECCESGSCNPCVWDFYYSELQKWRIQQAELKKSAEQKD
ncbi:oxidoreductase-like domain-containing protein [Thalassotalea maritima]|uniref:oxidoreductase-like domain-containing protein n=1 Tax=Thalassotalea maritima TaxID=3242416 RepID=UPI003529151B